MTPGGSRRVHLLVSGLVQGVAYRWSARDEALRLGVRGWVRNLDSGEVEAVAEGTLEAVGAFVAWCRRGPPAAEVSAVSVTEEPPAEDLSGFMIRR
jgi:acylphosphatase